MIDPRDVARRASRLLFSVVRSLTALAGRLLDTPVWRGVADLARRGWSPIRSLAVLVHARIGRLLQRVARWIANQPALAKGTAIAVVIGILAALAAIVIDRVIPERPTVTWTMINISAPGMLGDAHLLEFANGRNILIDTGWEATAHQYLFPFLENKGIRRLERVVVTNAKDSKAGGLSVLLESGIEVGSVSFNPPSEEVCNTEREWGCDYGMIMKRVRHWSRLSSVWPMETGQVLVDTGEAVLRVFITHDGLSPPVGTSTLADATSLLELQTGNNRVLFASDLGTTLGGYLADHRSADLDFNMLKVPHFGTWTHAPTRFFHALLPRLELALVPTIETQWASRRSVIVREALADVPTYLSERHGHVEVRLFQDRFEVATQKQGRSTGAN